MLWPPIAALLAAALIVTWAAWVGHARVSGLPATVITKSGRTMQVLTGKEWTTCNLAGRPQPCRRIDQPNKRK
jgi:hypothetical protein